MLYYICHVAKSETDIDTRIFKLPNIFTGDECITRLFSF